MPLPPAIAPRTWGIHLLAAVLVAVAVGLGLWQLEAWQARRAAEARDLTRATPLPLTAVMGPDDPFPGDRVGQPVEVSGTWVPGGTVLVSGREQDGREGWWVVTPLAVGGPRAPALEIVRGWTAAQDDVPPPPTGRADLVALLQPPEGSGQTDPDPRDDVLPELRIADAIQHVDQDLYGAYAVATTPVPGDTGLEPARLDQLPEAGRFTALRNLLYAVEWWFFGLFAAFVWWRWVREDILGERATGTDG